MTVGALVATGCQVAVAPAVAVETPAPVVSPAPVGFHVKHKPKPKPHLPRKVARKAKRVHRVTVTKVSHAPVSLAWLPPVWQRIAMCESSGDPHQWTGPYYGLFQINRGWFRSAGLDPESTTPAQQYALALKIWHRQGWAAWSCASILGID